MPGEPGPDKRESERRIIPLDQRAFNIFLLSIYYVISRLYDAGRKVFSADFEVTEEYTGDKIYFAVLKLIFLFKCT